MHVVFLHCEFFCKKIIIKARNNLLRLQFVTCLWVLREDDVENPLLQTSQICGFSPVWVRWCRFSRLGLSKAFPQMWHGSIVLVLALLTNGVLGVFGLSSIWLVTVSPNEPKRFQKFANGGKFNISLIFLPFPLKIVTVEPSTTEFLRTNANWFIGSIDGLFSFTKIGNKVAFSNESGSNRVTQVKVPLTSAWRKKKYFWKIAIS